jgi:hypothetical protein
MSDHIGRQAFVHVAGIAESWAAVFDTGPLADAYREAARAIRALLDGGRPELSNDDYCGVGCMALARAARSDGACLTCDADLGSPEGEIGKPTGASLGTPSALDDNRPKCEKVGAHESSAGGEGAGAQVVDPGSNAAKTNLAPAPGSSHCPACLGAGGFDATGHPTPSWRALADGHDRACAVCGGTGRAQP